MKRFIMLLITISCAISFMGAERGCTTNNAEREQQRKTDEMANEVNKQIGMPNIINFQERKLAKMIFELRDQENLICYAYIKSDYNGKLTYMGKCIGYGLPYSVQYTNPMKDHPDTWQFSIPQADPNQLYMPSGLSATWLMMIDPKTKKARPCYFEPEIVVSPFKLIYGVQE